MGTKAKRARRRRERRRRKIARQSRRAVSVTSEAPFDLFELRSELALYYLSRARHPVMRRSFREWSHGVNAQTNDGTTGGE